MPELVEVERYRRLAERVVGRTIAAVDVVDGHVLGGGTTQEQLSSALTGRAVAAVRRRGKLLLLDTTATSGRRAGRGPAASGPTEPPGPVLGMRFGMTGALVVDGRPGVDRLLHAPAAMREQWVRFRLVLARPAGTAGTGEGVTTLELHDPRRLGRVLLDPPEWALGPDAATVTPAELQTALTGRARGRTAGASVALKTRLLDQSRLAGVGNLTADEVLWRAGLSPLRPSAGLDPAELRRLHRHLRATLADLGRRGGSHTGDLMSERRAGGRCPKDGTALVRASIGGRTTWWCPAHQR